MERQCGDCRPCVEICPPQAFTGIPFDEQEDRSLRFDVRKCRDHLDRTEGTLGESVCGLCLYVCPFGRSETV